jgi:hypothetical protein
LSGSIGNGTNGSVNSITTDGTLIYIGGNFTLTDYNGTTGTTTYYIAYWDTSGSTWNTLYSSVPTKNGTNGQVRTLFYDSSNSNLYIGGSFTGTDFDGTTVSSGPYYNSVMWKSPAWSQVGDNATTQNGTNSDVYSIYYDTTNIYLGGSFSLGGYNPVDSYINANNITYYDGGTKWFNLLNNNTNVGVSGFVYAITVIGLDIYVGGDFQYTGPIFTGPTLVNNIARWNTTHKVWYPLNYNNSGVGDIGVGGIVRALATNGTLLFVGGDFTTTTNGFVLNYIGMWDPILNVWTQIISTDIGLNASVLCLNCRTPFTNLYIGGSFTTTTTGILLNYIGNLALNQMSNGIQPIQDILSNIGTNNPVYAALYNYPRINFGGSFSATGGAGTTIQMYNLGFYLYIYISLPIILNTPFPSTIQFLDTITGEIANTYTLSTRFKSVTLIYYTNLNPQYYWLIMFRS